jgi:epoxyqueuosine reductase
VLLARVLDRWSSAPAGPSAWPQFEAEVPSDLLSYPGERRNHDDEAQAASERPLHEFWTLHPEASEAMARHGLGYLLPTLPRLASAIRAVRIATRLRPATTTEADDPAGLTAALRDEARRIGASTLGIASRDDAYTFAEVDAQQFSKVVVCVVEQDWELTQRIPSDDAEAAAMHGYVEGMRRTALLATFLKQRGFAAAPQGFMGDGVAIHYAVQAGLGQLGLNGQLLTPQAGSRCRLLLLTTDAPLVEDQPVDYGMHGLCDECRICVRRCPVGAIPQQRKPYRGVTKAKLNTSRCLPVVVQASGCGVCMKVCPIQRYGLQAVLDHRARTGAILGKGSDELEGYDWPLDGKRYGPSRTPLVDAETLNDVPFDPQRAEPPAGVKPIRFVGAGLKP